MRRVMLGIYVAFAAAGAARAADYVVVRSTDPSIKAGLAVSGGQRLNVATGQTVTLIAAAGDVTLLKGGPSGAVAPARAVQADAGRLESLRVLVDPPPEGRTFGGRRGGVCPDPASLKTVDEILAVQKAGCGAAAREALDALAATAAQ